MSDLNDLLVLHTRALEIATDFVDAVGSDDDGGLLVVMCRHNHEAAAAIRGTGGPFTPRPDRGAHQWRQTSADVHGAATDAVHDGSVSARVAIEAHLLDVVVHTRVLATLLGLDWRPTPATTDAIVAVARAVPGGEQRLATSGLVGSDE